VLDLDHPIALAHGLGEARRRFVAARGDAFVRRSETARQGMGVVARS
jgi:hypothetical protein